jgi:hypothetical protein
MWIFTWVASHFLAIVGSALLAGVAWLIWRRPTESSPTTIIFLAAVALILLSDERLSNFKVGSSGIEVSRADLTKTKEDYASQIAKVAGGLEEQRRIVEEQKKLIVAQQATLDVLTKKPADAPKPDELNKIEQIRKTFAEKSKYSVLVFYRTAKRREGEALAKALLDAGYQSSATGSDLTEVVADIAGDRQPGKVFLAAKSLQLPVLGDVRAITERVAQANGLKSPTVDDEEWTFRRGDIQIYLF